MEKGVIVNVVPKDAGAFVEEEALSGDGLIVVDDASAFSTEGGTLLAYFDTGDPKQQSYSAALKSEDSSLSDTLLVPAGLGGNLPVGSFIRTYPVRKSIMAYVRLDSQKNDEAIEVFVPSDNNTNLATGIRDPGSEEPVFVEYINGRYEITQIEGQPPVVYSEFLDVPIPDPNDLDPVVAPGASPSLSVTGNADGFVIVANNDANLQVTDIIDYYMDDVVVASGTSRVVFITELPDGTPLSQTDPSLIHNFRAFAYNSKGAAPLPGPDTTAQLNGAISEQQVIAKLNAAIAQFGELKVGNISINVNTGITVSYTNGGVRIPANSAERVVFTGVKIDTDSITVRGGLVLNGTNNTINGRMVVSSAVADPSEYPTNSPEYTPRLKNGYSTPAGWEFISAELLSDTRIGVLIRNNATWSWRVRLLDKSNNLNVISDLISGTGADKTTGFWPIDLSRNGNTLLIMGRVWSSPRNGVWNYYLYRYSISDGSFIGRALLSNSAHPAGTGYYDPDATDADAFTRIAYNAADDEVWAINRTITNNVAKLNAFKFPPAGGNLKSNIALQTPTDLPVDTNSYDFHVLRGATMTVADTGRASTEPILWLSVFHDNPNKYLGVLPFTRAGAYFSGWDFNSYALGVDPIFWDGSVFWGVADIDKLYPRTTVNPNKTGLQYSLRYKYAFSNTTSKHTTKALASISQYSRREAVYALINPPALQGSDSPNSLDIYVLDANNKYRLTYQIPFTPESATVLRFYTTTPEYVNTSGALEPTTNTFSANANPGGLESATARPMETRYNGDLNSKMEWSLEGSGQGRVGPLSWYVDPNTNKYVQAFYTPNLFLFESGRGGYGARKWDEDGDVGDGKTGLSNAFQSGGYLEGSHQAGLFKRASAASIGSGGWSQLTVDSVQIASSRLFTLVNGHIKFLKMGLYEIYYQIPWATSTAGRRLCRGHVVDDTDFGSLSSIPGSATGLEIYSELGASANEHVHTGSMLVYANYNWHLVMTVYQNSGAALAINVDRLRLQVRKVG